MPDVNTPRYPAFAASGSQAFAAGGQPFAPGSQPFAAIPNGAQRPVQPASITPRTGNGLPQGPFPLQVRPAGNLPVALNGARQAPASLTGTAVEDFFKGSITTGLLATLQQKSHQPQGHHVAAIAGKLNRTTLRLALQGGVALAAGTASARALRQSRPGAALLAAKSDGAWFSNPAITRKLGPAALETFGMLLVSGLITIVVGLFLGLALVTTGARGQHRNRVVYEVLSQVVNIGRSMPFIILMVALIPLTRLLVGTSLGWQAACVPLTIGAIPFYARLVETAINDVDRGKVEAALMMGASGRQITWGVLVREALPILIQSATVTIITLLGYSAMAGAVGGGGVGDLAIQYGYQRNQVDVMVITVVVIVGIVGIIQLVGDMLSRLVNHR